MSRRLRLAIVTSQFPVAGDPTRGRPVYQTIEALTRIVESEVFVPNARYPARFTPRSYRYVPLDDSAALVNDARVRYVSYPTLPLVGRLVNGWMAGKSLRTPILRFRPDVVLAYWLYPDAFGAVAVADELGISLVSGARGSDIRARDRVSLMLTRHVLARSSRVLTVSEDLRRIAVERFGAAPERTTTIANGCNTDIFMPRSREAARSSLGIPASGRLILFVGRLMPAKGVRELLAAWLEIATRQPDVDLAFIGTGTLHDELSRRAAAAGIGSRLHVPGAVPAETVAAWMQACNVLCLPSHTEGYPNVLVEALACGRPVVATPVGGILEIVDRSNGLLTPVGDVGRLAAALQEALSRPWDEAALSRRFTRSWDDVARETLAVCETALKLDSVNDRASSRDRW